MNLEINDRKYETQNCFMERKNKNIQNRLL